MKFYKTMLFVMGVFFYWLDYLHGCCRVSMCWRPALLR